MMKNSNKPKRSLKTFVWVYMIVLIAIVVVTYTFLLRSYLYQGAIISTLYPMEAEAQIFADNYKKNPNIELPHTSLIRGYLDDNRIPEAIRELHPPEEREHQKIVTREWWPRGTVERTTDNSHTLIFLPWDLHDGKQLLLIFHSSPEQRRELSDSKFFRLVNLIIPVAIGVFVFFILALLYLIRKVSAQISAIRKWASQLTQENLDQRPQFQFEELEQIASILQGSLSRVKVTLEREQMFLRHASHEMRTPLAVIKSNMELLNAINLKHGIDNHENPALMRIERATKNMQQITETMLWLGRETESSFETVSVNTREFLMEIIEDNSYLLEGKSIDLQLDITEKMNELPVAPLRITISNLVRNAFQYTQDGRVAIRYGNNSLVIENQSLGDETELPVSSEYGFGLGLKLVKLLCKKMGWQYQSTEIPGGRRVELTP